MLSLPNTALHNNGAIRCFDIALRGLRRENRRKDEYRGWRGGEMKGEETRLFM